MSIDLALALPQLDGVAGHCGNGLLDALSLVRRNVGIQVNVYLRNGARRVSRLVGHLGASILPVEPGRIGTVSDG